ncbi:MAG: S1 family peptidase [Candidatus Hydrogenedentales bacterium]|jgi:S1-C subfamily serine protease
MRSWYLGMGLCIALLWLGSGADTAHADTLADTAREVVDANKQAVVTIKLVVENRYSMEGRGSQSEESTSEITGTVIDPSGLTVVSLFTTDPSSASRNMMGMGLEEMGVKIETEIKRADILAVDGKEIPAEVVLRDKDLDLAFLRPKQLPENPFAPLELAQAGAVKLLEPIVVINRLGRVANRTHGAVLDRIEAVVEKPRTFYVPMGGALNAGSLGAPVFTLEGEVVGILVLRTIRSSGSDMMRMMGMGGGSDNALMILLPASDVLEAAAQAPEHALAQPQEQADDAESPGETPPVEVTAPEG